MDMYKQILTLNQTEVMMQFDTGVGLNSGGLL